MHREHIARCCANRRMDRSAARAVRRANRQGLPAGRIAAERRMTLAPILVSLLVAWQPSKESISAKRDRLTRTVAELHAAGKYAEAVDPAEQLLAMDKR